MILLFLSVGLPKITGFSEKSTVHHRSEKNIEHKIEKIRVSTLKNAASNSKKRTSFCIREKGSHFQYLL